MRRLVVRLIELGAVLALPLVAQAVSLDKLKVNVIDDPKITFVTALGRLADVFLYWGGVIAFIYVLYAGFAYLMAGGDKDAADKSKQTITNVIIGIILIAFTLVLVRYVTYQSQTNFQTPTAG